MISLKSFESMILFFNGMYKLPIATHPTVSEEIKNSKNRAGPAFPYTDIEVVAGRVANFQNILHEEFAEVEDIKMSLISGYRCKDGTVIEPVEEYKEIEFLTDMADWLGDIQVYCASEMARLGIPIDETLKIIMDSNFSKLGADGEPIYDERGKVQKGPSYWKPEPAIKEMLEAKIAEHNSPTGV